jgi:hypothetical protein
MVVKPLTAAEVALKVAVSPIPGTIRGSKSQLVFNDHSALVEPSQVSLVARAEGTTPSGASPPRSAAMESARTRAVRRREME